ncbi:RhuM family protein [Sphaerimonospora mesophila]|uniref:virulence RhuM family protein n=1 Tax=Sphaerimonospora mesophila TaxID=37483 RepID=UPI000B27D6E4
MSEPAGELILYRTEDGRNQIQMRAVGGTVWLTQAQMAELFDTGTPNINKHITSILDDGELTEATISSQEIVRQEGARQVRREVLVYNLDMILAVGYRVRSPRGIQFRQWANTTPPQPRRSAQRAPSEDQVIDDQSIMTLLLRNPRFSSNNVMIDGEAALPRVQRLWQNTKAKTAREQLWRIDD